MITGRPWKVYVFYCGASFDTAAFVSGCADFVADLKLVPVPCSGKVDTLYLTKAFETGADGAAIVTCDAGECRYLEGNLRARKRAGAVEALLGEIGLGKGRVEVIHMSQGDMAGIVRQVRAFHSRVQAMPRQSPPTGIPGAP
jgi:coenzyme F420-reducing hydrogenase delta subunit